MRCSYKLSPRLILSLKEAPDLNVRLPEVHLFYIKSTVLTGVPMKAIIIQDLFHGVQNYGRNSTELLVFDELGLLFPSSCSSFFTRTNMSNVYLISFVQSNGVARHIENQWFGTMQLITQVIPTRLAASWGLPWPAGFESGFGFEATGFGFRFGFKKKGVDSDSAGFGFEVPGFGSGFGFEMAGFAHHCMG